MSSTVPKPTRSRISSPGVRANSPSGHTQSRGAGGLGGAMATGSGSGSDGSRTFMQRWLEPPVNNKPSFQDAGLMRVGVVENMAPLGTLPKVAALKKNVASAESPPPTSAGVTKIVLVNRKPQNSTPASSIAATPNARDNTPGISRTPSTESGVDSVDIFHALPLPIPVDDADDEDYVPKKRSRSRRHSPSGATSSVNPLRRQSHRYRSSQSSPAPSLAVASAAPVPAPTPLLTTTPAPAPIDPALPSLSTPTPTPTLTLNPFPTPAPVPISSHEPEQASTIPPLDQPPEDQSPIPLSPSHSDSVAGHLVGREPDDKEQVDKVVEAAVDEAIRHRRFPTAWALRVLYDENNSDPRFVSMIEDIFYQRASRHIVDKFARMVNERKKDGKKENKGRDYFVPAPTNSHFSSPKPEPAPYRDALRMDFAAIVRQSVSDFDSHDQHVNKKRKTESMDRQQQTESRAADAGPELSVTARTDLNPDGAKGGAAQVHGHGENSHQRHHKTKSPKKSPKKKRTRAGSVSSTSSLSSVPDDAIEDYQDFMSMVDDDLSVSRSEGGDPAPIPAGSEQPIKSGHAKSAVKKNDPSPNPASSSQNTPATVSAHQPSARPSMPNTTTATITTNGGTTTTPQPSSTPVPGLKFASRFGQVEEASDGFARKKLDTKSKTAATTNDNSEESFVREPLHEFELPEDLTLLSLPPPPRAITAQALLSQTPVPPQSSRAARAAKRNHDDLDDASSPTASSFRAERERSSARNSRAATPANARSSKKPRGGLRVKTSPMKKKGTSAGVPRGTGERPSPVGSGPNHNQDDNDDSCFSCGGNGELVCCDGCACSFHFNCIDPPMDERHVPDEWFCRDCQFRFFPPLKSPHEGVFGALLNNIDRKNPRAFRLPDYIREYFEGVKTGPEGEYEEIVPAKPKTSRKNAEEAFDFFKVRNGDKAVLCHHCHKGAVDNQPIIPCSVCGLNWHLECLDPPLAIPPVVRTWRCPCHVEDLLSEIPARLAPAHKYRKIKNAPVIEQGYSRGMANNGHIEIIEDDSDEDDSAEAWREERSFGRVFRISAKGIKKDFLAKVGQTRAQTTLTPSGVSNPARNVPPSLDEQQAALNLLSLAQNPTGGADQLIQALVSEAPPAAVTLMAQGDVQRFTRGHLTRADTTALETMLAQVDALRQGISQVLDGRTKRSKPSTETLLSESKALTPNSISHDDSTVVDELRLDMESSQGTNKLSEVDRKPSVDDTSVQLD